MKITPRAERQRRGLLAKVHIAIKDLCINDDTYRDILRREFGVASAAALSNRELESLVRYFQSKGWSPKQGKSQPDQVGALRERALGLKAQMRMSNMRFSRLCRRICGTDRLEWCREVSKLKRLLAVMEKIRRSS